MAVNLIAPSNVSVLNEAAAFAPLSGGNPSALYTPGGSVTAKIEKATICNTDSSAHAFSIGIAPSSSMGTVGNSAWIIDGLSLGAGDSLGLADYLEGAWLLPTDAVFGFSPSTLLILSLSLMVYS